MTSRETQQLIKVLDYWLSAVGSNQQAWPPVSGDARYTKSIYALLCRYIVCCPLCYCLRARPHCCVLCDVLWDLLLTWHMALNPYSLLSMKFKLNIVFIWVMWVQINEVVVGLYEHTFIHSVLGCIQRWHFIGVLAKNVGAWGCVTRSP